MTPEGSKNRLRLYQWIAGIAAAQGGLNMLGLPPMVENGLIFVFAVTASILACTRAFIDQSPAAAEETAKQNEKEKPPYLNP